MGLAKFQYSKEEWFIIKLLTLSLWIYPVIKVIGRYHSIPFPEGVCLFFDFSFLTRSPWSLVVVVATIVFSLCYLFERYMVFTTLMLCLISIIVFSIERSNGIYHRKELLSIVFIVQFIAYFRFYLNSRKSKPVAPAFNLAIAYSVQVIAAAYVIAGLTKLSDSGLGWITESPNAAVQVLKSFGQKSIDLESSGLMAYGRWMTGIFMDYPNMIRTIMAFALSVELFAFIAMTNKKTARWYGVLLLIMHFGMLFLLGIILIAFMGLVLIYLINVPGLLLAIWQRIKPVKNDAERYFMEKEDQQSVFSFFRQMKMHLIFILLPIAYIVVNYAAGENHPFSRFQMYSEFPREADYFYLADGNNQPISCYRNFNFRTNELKDMIQAKVKSYALNRNLNAQLAGPAGEVLDFIVENNKANPNFKKFSDLRLIRHEIKIGNHSIAEQDFILGAVKIPR